MYVQAYRHAPHRLIMPVIGLRARTGISMQEHEVQLQNEVKLRQEAETMKARYENAHGGEYPSSFSPLPADAPFRHRRSAKGP